MITVQATINAGVETIWNCWTTPVDIAQWNKPSDDWETTFIEIDLKNQGSFLFRMKMKNGDNGFDFSGKYDKVIKNELIEYTVSDGRKVINTFVPEGNITTITETFEPEDQTPPEVQRNFVQSVLNAFKKYTETKQ